MGRLLEKGYPKLDSITWRPVVDNNTRAAMLQTGEANFAFPVPYEQAKLLEKDSKLDVVVSPSIMQRYISLNVTQNRLIIRKCVRRWSTRSTARHWLKLRSPVMPHLLPA